MSFQSLLDKTATLYEVTSNVNEWGDPIRIQTIVESGLPCRLVQLSGAEKESGGTEKARGSHKVFFDGDITYLTEQHFIVIEEIRYDILYVYRVRAQTDSVHHLEVYVIEDVDTSTEDEDYTYFIWEQKKYLKDDIWISENNEIMITEGSTVSYNLIWFFQN